MTTDPPSPLGRDAKEDRAPKGGKIVWERGQLSRCLLFDGQRRKRNGALVT
jgi:hypothetical protein